MEIDEEDVPEVTCRETGKQLYLRETHCVISAGLIDNHPTDSLYIQVDRGDDDVVTLSFRPDELATLIHLASGALWSHMIEEQVEGDSLEFVEYDDALGSDNLISDN